MFGSVLSRDAQKTLALLGKSGLVTNAYLAGGSALALQFGHRYSIDFDFFSPIKFDPKQLSVALSGLGRFKEEAARGISLLGEFRGIKLSYFQYDYPLIAPRENFLGVSVAHYQDIAAMKLVAISDRTTKKDFVDLYEIIQQGNTFEDMFLWYDKKYKLFDANYFTILKSIEYFDEAEKTDMPKMIRPISWEEVKQFFVAESLRLGKKYLEAK